MTLVSIIARLKREYKQLTYKLRLKLQRFIRKYPVIVTNRYGIRVIVYPWDIHPLKEIINREYDIVDFEIIRKIIKPKSISFDIGANIGIYSIFISKLVGNEGKVYAFEPVPETFWQLNETIVINRCQNIKAFNYAISDNNSQIEMNLFDQEFSEWNSFGKPLMSTVLGDISPKNKIKVQTFTLDNFCKTYAIERIDFLKVDVEGFEKFVFKGGQDLLKNKKIDFIYFEISLEPLKGAGVKAREVFEILKDYGYFSYQVMPNYLIGPVFDSQEYHANYLALLRELTKDERKF